MINTSESRIIFNGNGTATEFPYSFAIINDTDVKVMTVDPDGVETVLDSDYYVDVTAGKVIYPGYPPGEEPAESERPPVLPTGWQLVVYRDIPITQEANLGNVWPFNVIEDALDKITMILQNIYDGFKRSFKVSQSAPADIDIYVPIEANKALKWNADGTQIVTTVDPADVLPQAQNLLQQTTEQANIATNKATAAAESALAAATSETNAGEHEDKAKAWAESETSPDGEPDSKSAKTWAEEAAESASAAMSSKNAAANSATQAAQSAENAGNAAEEAVGNPVMSVGISGKTITVTKKDSTTVTFDVPAPDAATETEATTGTDNTKMMTPLRVAQATAALTASVTESNGTVTVKTKGGTSNTFIIIKTINGKAPTNGNFDIKGIPLDSNGTISPWQHNGIFRGKNLGSSVTAAQWAAIQAGTFDDLYIGDYWTINGVEWVIVAFDYYYNTGDTACTTHHVVVIPRTNLYNAQMNESNVTTGAYVGSKMYTTNLNQAKTTIQNAFGASHLLSIRQYFQNATTDGYETGGTWYDATVWLMSEANVYGGNVFKSVINGTGWPNLYSIDNRQYPYFRFALPNEQRVWYWLRDVATSSSFADVSGLGNSNTGLASSSSGVRPAFCIKAS